MFIVRIVEVVCGVIKRSQYLKIGGYFFVLLSVRVLFFYLQIFTFNFVNKKCCKPKKTDSSTVKL